MDPSEIQQAIREYFSSADPDQAFAIKEDQNLFEANIIDSLGIINLVLYLEETFAVTLSYEDMTEENFRSLDALVILIQNSKQASSL